MDESAFGDVSLRYGRARSMSSAPIDAVTGIVARSPPLSTKPLDVHDKAEQRLRYADDQQRDVRPRVIAPPRPRA
jgi:hypothetical protein